MNNKSRDEHDKFYCYDATWGCLLISKDVEKTAKVKESWLHQKHTLYGCLSSYIADNKKQAATAVFKIGKITTKIVKMKKKMDIDDIFEIKKKMDTNVIEEKKEKMDIDAIKEKKKMLDDKEKSKDVFEWKGEELKLDCIYENSPLGFDKSLSSGLKKMESQDPLKEVNLGT